jgi:hypothetical protein
LRGHNTLICEHASRCGQTWPIVSVEAALAADAAFAKIDACFACYPHGGQDRHMLLLLLLLLLLRQKASAGGAVCAMSLRGGTA